MSIDPSLQHEQIPFVLSTYRPLFVLIEVNLGFDGLFLPSSTVAAS